MVQPAARRGFQIFTFIWLGQLVSLVGTGLTGFALGVWAYQTTGSVTQYALIALFNVLPGILVSPFAGVLVDRWDRRWALILSDSGSAVCVLTIALLFWTGQLQVWHIYIAVALSATFNVFQWPAYSAATSLLVPKQQLGRVNGMIQLADAVSQLVAPVVAGLLVSAIQLQGVLLIDVLTYLFSVTILLLIRIPAPPRSEDAASRKPSLWREAVYGWTYITSRRGLLGLLTFFAINNFLINIVVVLTTPLVLAFGSPRVLGTVLSVGGSGFLFGSLAMSVWGGTRRRVYSVFGPTLLAALSIITAGIWPSAIVFAGAAFVFFFCSPISSASSQAIWQSKVAADVQGRVFATRRMIAQSCVPLAYLLAGPLADGVFEPLMAPGGALAGTLGQVLGVGPGRGIGLLFVIMGCFTVLATIIGFSIPAIRNVERDLPDAITTEQTLKPAAPLDEPAVTLNEQQAAP